MTIKVRRYISTVLDVYIPGGILFAIMLMIEELFKLELDINLTAGGIWGIILMKDIFDGQSVFKKLSGLRIVDKNTQKPIKPLISIIRNFISLPLFPIEIITFIFFEKRISDWIFKTEVVEANKIKIKLIISELCRYRLVDYFKDYMISFMLAVIGFNIYFWVWMNLLPGVLSLTE